MFFACRKVFHAVFLGIFLFVTLLSAQEEVYLKRTDIARLMQEILDQHLDKKDMNRELMREALQNYVQQFDPQGLYLIQREVDPFVNPQNHELDSYIALYRQGRYDIFTHLDELVQRSINRARRYRQVMESNPEPLFGAKPQGFTEPEGYALDKNALRQRMKNDLLAYIRMQKERYGDEAVLKRQKHILTMYEQERRDWEDGYLYFASDGSPLSDKQREHQFSLHVLKAMARSLDSHTRFLNPSEARDMRTRLLKGYIGTGLVFEQGIEGIEIVRVIPDSPAAKDGNIKEGDILVRVEETDVDSQSFQKSMDLLEGDAGKPVRLTLKRGGSNYTATLVRENIFLDTDRVSTSFIPFDGGIIGKITLNSFYRNDNGISSEQDVKKALDELRKQGSLRGLVLDLRENAGGYLSEAVKVAGLFISNGVVVMSQYHNGERHYYRDIDGKTFYDGPLVVLISRSTASAAEIVAQALQDYGVAVVAGDDRSYGKGSIQSQNVTDNNAASFYKVTVGKYYTVSGKTPQVQGVTSDIMIPGKRVYENIGEQYLSDALPNDKIEEAFEDRLQDVRPEARSWFVRYYLPTLQPRKTSWQRMLPELKRRSSERLANLPALRSSTGFSSGQQMSEAVNVIRDMVQLRSHLNTGQIGSYD
ncbi:MAG: PDZ domain-containing protein [Chlamydiia bacterium]|nr:PDZ domain-containing protein [Chlamydiia bacterium]